MDRNGTKEPGEHSFSREAESYLDLLGKLEKTPLWVCLTGLYVYEDTPDEDRANDNPTAHGALRAIEEAATVFLTELMRCLRNMDQGQIGAVLQKWGLDDNTIKDVKELHGRIIQHAKEQTAGPDPTSAMDLAELLAVEILLHEHEMLADSNDTGFDRKKFDSDRQKITGIHPVLGPESPILWISYTPQDLWHILVESLREHLQLTGESAQN